MPVGHAGRPTARAQRRTEAHRRISGWKAAKTCPNSQDMHRSSALIRHCMALAATTVLLTLATPASARSSAAAADGCIDITRYDVDSRATQDAAPAFQAAVRASNPHAVCIYFPTGIYRFSTSPTVAMAAGAANARDTVIIRGDGAGATRLLFAPDVDGLSIHLNGPQQSVHIRDLSVLAGNRSQRTTGIAVLQENAALPNSALSAISGAEFFCARFPTSI
jgi:hypothetical protein